MPAYPHGVAEIEPVQTLLIVVAMMCGAIVPNVAGYLNARRRQIRWSPFTTSFASFNAREWSVLAAGVAAFFVLGGIASTIG